MSKPMRHGDVLIIPCEDIQGEEIKSNTLAEGEVTGHSHRIEGAGKLFKWNEKMYLKVTGDCWVRHEEHARGYIPEGTYEIGIQRDYEPEGWTRVKD